MIPCFSSHSVVAAHAGLVSMDPVNGTQAQSDTAAAVAGHFSTCLYVPPASPGHFCVCSLPPGWLWKPLSSAWRRFCLSYFLLLWRDTVTKARYKRAFNGTLAVTEGQSL